MARNLIKGDNTFEIVEGGGFPINLESVKSGDKFNLSFDFNKDYNRENQKCEEINVSLGSCLDNGSSFFLVLSSLTTSQRISLDTSKTYQTTLEITKDFTNIDNEVIGIYYWSYGDGEMVYPTLQNVILTEQEPEYKYTLKKIEKSDSRNLIIGDTREVSFTDSIIFKINDSIHKGDKLILHCSEYNDIPSTDISLNDQLNDRFNPLFDEEILIDLPYIFTACRDSVGDIQLCLNNFDDTEVIIKNLMLNKGDTPIPWENNLGDQEVVIGEIRKSGIANSIYKDYINIEISKGSNKDIIELNGPFKSDQQFILQYAGKKDHSVIPVEELKGGGDVHISVYNDSDQIVSSQSIPYMTDTNDYVYYRFSINEDCERIILRGYTSIPGESYIEWYDVFLFQGNTPVKSYEAHPEISLSPVYKGEEKIWKKENEPNYIIETPIFNANYDAEVRVYVKESWLDKILTPSVSDSANTQKTNNPEFIEFINEIRNVLKMPEDGYFIADTIVSDDKAFQINTLIPNYIFTAKLYINNGYVDYLYKYKNSDGSDYPIKIGEIENGYFVCTAAYDLD